MKSPSFQFYPKDWLSSRRVRMMTAEQRGWYIQLLCEAWESEVQGTLPSDPKILWQLAGATDEQVFNKCSTSVLSMFEHVGENLIHHRLCEEKAKQQQMSELRAKAGRESGRARRQLLKDKHLARLNKCSVSVEQNTNTPSSIASASAISTAIIPEAERAMKVNGYHSVSFERFWGKYPWKTGKPKAWKEWEAHSCDLLIDKILAALDVQIASEEWKKEKGKWIPKPHNWLLNESWNNEPKELLKPKPITYGSDWTS